MTEISYKTYESPVLKSSINFEKPFEEVNGARYYEQINPVRNYFTAWKNSRCEYLKNVSEDSSVAFSTVEYVLDDDQSVINKSTWVTLEYMEQNYWNNSDNLISKIHQKDTLEDGSIHDFPKCNPKILRVDTLLNQDQSITNFTPYIPLFNDDGVYDPNLLEQFKTYTAFVQRLKGNDIDKSGNVGDLDWDNSEYRIIWSSYLLTNGDKLEWSQYPNVMLNYDIQFNIGVGSNTITLEQFKIILDKNLIPKNLNNHTLTVVFKNTFNSKLTETIKLYGFYGGDVILQSETGALEFTNGADLNQLIECYNIQSLKISGFKLFNNSQKNGFVSGLKCRNIKNLTISNCTFKSNVIEVEQSNKLEEYCKANFYDNIKAFSNSNRVTNGLYIENCNCVIVGNKFEHSLVMIVVDENSNLYCPPQTDNQQMSNVNGVNTIVIPSRTNTLYSFVNCVRHPSVIFYCTGNSKVSAYLPKQNDISMYSLIDQNKSIFYREMFDTDPDKILSICDPGSLFNHDRHEAYNTGNYNNNSTNILPGLMFETSKRLITGTNDQLMYLDNKDLIYNKTNENQSFINNMFRWCLSIGNDNRVTTNEFKQLWIGENTVNSWGRLLYDTKGNYFTVMRLANTKGITGNEFI